MRYKRYNDLSSLDRRRRKALRSLLFDGEEFIMAIDCKEGRLRSKTNRKLVLTDSRIIMFEKGLVGAESEDYSLDNVTSIQFDKGLRSSSIRLQGPGIDDEYPAAKGHGEAFVKAAQKQKHRDY